MAEVSAGRILIMAVGNYNAATPYEPLDLVAYNDESWLCRKACTGVTPTAQASEYWQKFGSAVGIATLTNTGVVRPDGSSIKIIADGTISVPTATGEALGLVKPDGSTITIDANGTLTANAAGALSDLTDVDITSASQGQILQYNVTSHKWENVTKQFLTELEQMLDVDIDDSTLADGQALIYDVATGKWQNKAITQYPKLDTVEQVMANTASGKVADALAIKTINTNLTESLGGVEFQIDSVNNKGQYSIDGGTTWQNFSSGGLNDDTAGTLYQNYTSFPAVPAEGLALVCVTNKTGGGEIFDIFLTRDGVEESIGALGPADNAVGYLTTKLFKIKPGDTFRAQRRFNPSGGMFAYLGFYLYQFE